MALFGQATRIDNLLQERSKLIFEFPTTDSNTSLDRVCPFFENPIISEKKTANLVKYDVIGRTSNFFGFTGAKSKKISVSFDMTLPHIVNMATNELFTQPPAAMTTLQKQQEFFNKKVEKNESRISETNYEKKREIFLNKINGVVGGKSDSNRNAITNTLVAAQTNVLGQTTANAIGTTASTPEADLASDLQAYSKPFIFAQAIDVMLFWIELIRMSTLSSRQKPTLGPPIIRLNHGVLFNNIATIAESYSITIDEAAGYDIVSLLPNRIKIQLSLLEVQRNYDVRDLTGKDTRDLAKGWDDLLIEKDPQLNSGVWEDPLTRGSL